MFAKTSEGSFLHLFLGDLQGIFACLCDSQSFFSSTIFHTAWYIFCPYTFYSQIEKERINLFTYTHTYIHTYIHIHKNIHASKHTYINIYIPTNVCVYIYIYIYIYTGCPRRKGQNFGRVFLMLKYTDITQNTYIQS